jgi:hypothetical protein
MRKVLILAGLVLLGCSGAPSDAKPSKPAAAAGDSGSNGGSGTGGSSQGSGGEAGDGSAGQLSYAGESSGGTSGGSKGSSGSAGSTGGDDGGTGGVSGSSNAGDGGADGTGCQALTYDQVCATLPNKTCGKVDDGCGGELDCGGCPTNRYCVDETNTCKLTVDLCRETMGGSYGYCVVSGSKKDPVYCSEPGDPDGTCAYDSESACYYCNGAKP